MGVSLICDDWGWARRFVESTNARQIIFGWRTSKAGSLARILHEGGHLAEVLSYESRVLGSIGAMVFDGTLCPDRFSEKSGVASDSIPLEP
jgi:hypothetical protein